MIEWRPVVGFEGKYEVSACGRVRRCGRVISRSNGATYTVAPKELRQCKTGRDGGYRLVGVKVAPGKRGTRLVHRLVAEAFLENPDALRAVNHKNLVKDDNRVENLEWITDRGNQEHAAKRGLYHGQTNAKARYKLQPCDVDSIREDLRLGRRQDDIAERHGVSQSMISMIKMGKSWADPAKVFAHVA